MIERTKKASFRGTSSFNEGFNFSNPFSKNFQEKKEFQRKTEEKQNTPININRASTSQNSVNTSDFIAANPDDIQEGMRVLHQKFGQGEVLKVEGIGPNKKATVLFDECGSKQLMLKFAKLNILK